MRSYPKKMLPVVCIAALAQIASADIHWNTYSRVVAGGFTNGFDLDFVSDQTGYSNPSIFFTYPRLNRSYDVKVVNETYLGDEVYKANTLLNIQTDLRNPVVNIGGCLSDGQARFELTQRTTIKINHELIGELIHRDSFAISVTNTTTNTDVFSIEGSPTSNASIITLEAGSYEMNDFCEIIGFENSEPQSRTVRYAVSVSVVPAPTTLAAITPLGIAATRRRR